MGKRLKKKNKLTKKDIIMRIIFVIAVTVFIVSGYMLFDIWNEYRKNKVVYNEVKEYKPEKIVDDETGEEKYKFKQEDYDKLLSINGDFKGWLYVPGTKVDYPVVQSTDNDYYLNHNFYKEYNEGGAIFMASENEVPFGDANTVIHGHHMNDGSMFASLGYYKDAEFFRNNKIIYVFTKSDVLEYEIFSVYYEEANTNPYKYKFATDDEMVQFFNELKSKSFFISDTAEFTVKDKIITLSTCTYEIDDGRLLVHGRLIQNN